MPRPPAAALVATVVAAALGLGGCGGEDADEALPPQLDGGVEIAETITVDDGRFEPDEVTVEPGASVEWINEDDVAHTITAEDDLFDSGVIEPGESFVFTFDAPGTAAYGCSVHPDMTGSVAIRSARESR